MKQGQEHTDITLDYYNNNASAFTADTQNVDFSKFQKDFLHYIPAGGLILDLGCGAGRDSKAFRDAGYNVDAVDGSEALCKIAESYIGQPVTCTKFQDFEPQGMYDGIWACASLLHLSPDEITELLKKLVEHLKPSGCMYLSFKYGEFSGFKNGRFFQHMTESSFSQMLQTIPNIRVAELNISKDVRPDRNCEQWLNAILQLKMDNESSELLLSAANIHLEKYRFTLYEAYEDENGNTQPTGKIIFSIQSKDQKLNIYNDTKAIYETIIDLCEKISTSFAYTYEGIAKLRTEGAWNPFMAASANENLTFYFIENVVFRTSVLWDLLAQLYNVLWNIGKKPHQIHAKEFFIELNKKEAYKQATGDIVLYFNKTGDDGHFCFVKHYRNQLTHRASPNISNLPSDSEAGLRQHPLYVACRVAFDYLKALEFINDALDKLDEIIGQRLPQ